MPELDAAAGELEGRLKAEVGGSDTGLDREQMLRALPRLMERLYESGDYFVRVPPGRAAAYEETYWHEVTDPDGRRRNRLEERDAHVADVQEELTFVRSLGGGRLLDAGCGLGFFLSALDESWERHGLELSRFAAEHAAKYGDIRVGSIEDCPYEDAAFDVVLCHHVIEHLEDPLRGLRELRRVLRPGGFLVLGTPDFDSGAARRYRERYRLLADPTHISLFSNDSMHRCLRDHAFRIRRVHYPYFATRHFSEASLLRLLDDTQTSPAFYGNFMTFYCQR